MTELFLKLLNMSITASWVVLAVMLLRLCLRKTPKYIHCLLWAIVALRLVIPITWESAISLIPSAEVLPQNIVASPAIQSGIPAINGAVNPVLGQQIATGVNPIEQILQIAAIVWLVGMGILLVYNLVSYLRLHWQVQASLQMYGNVYVCDNVQSPFILGILFPKIYLPSGLTEEQMRYVLDHEYAHIKRKDHWWKPLGFYLLTVYWFNPLLWVAYILLCRDIEWACDERVVVRMDDNGKKGYSLALIACSAHRRMVMACPVAFGEVGVKERIKGVLNFKKPAFWVVIASMVVWFVASGCFLTNPKACRHDYTGVITVEATCTQKGLQTFTCEKCQYCHTEPVALKMHNYAPTRVLEESTCVEFGIQELKCVDCGKISTQQIEKTPHIAGEPYFITEPNCTETGTQHATCTFCQGVFLNQVLETNDVHDLEETVVKEPTCTETGEGVMTCSRCDYSELCAYEQLEHPYEIVEIYRLSCIESVMRQVCTECGDEKKSVLYMNNHSYVNNGSTCEICGFSEINYGRFPMNNTGEGRDLSDLWDLDPNQYPRPDGNGWTPDQPIIWDISGDISPKP